MYRHLKKLIPFFVLIALMLIVYLTNIHQELTLDNLRRKDVLLKDFVTTHPFLSPLLFMGIYIISVCLVIPDSIILTILSGLIFPLPLAVLYCVLSETIGAIIFFIIFQFAFGDTFFQRERPFLQKMRKQFSAHAASYLLFLRISHLLPFWFINVTAAYFKVAYKTFTWTTLIGVFPLTYVLADAGHDLSKSFAKNVHLSMGDIFNTELKILLFIAGLLALLPITIITLINYWKR